jgi:hypothetical protein
LHKGSVYVAFGTNGGFEFSVKYHGWVFRFDADSFECLGNFNSTPNEGSPSSTGATGAGIWQGGGGVTADDSGQVYIMTGNGSDVNPAAGGGQPGSYGDSMIRLSPRGNSLQFRGRFGTDSNNLLKLNDWDFGSAGPVAVPGTATIIGGGKDGRYFVANSGALEGASATVAQTFQAFTNVYDLSWRSHSNWYNSPHIHGQQVFWNNYLYHQAELDVFKAFQYLPASGTLSTTPIVASDRRVSPLGGFMYARESLSANGTDTADAVLWLRHQTRDDASTGCEGAEGSRPYVGRLTAYRALPSGNELECLQSYQLPGFAAGAPPTVAGGKVFVAAYDPTKPVASQNFIRVYKLSPTNSGLPDCAFDALPTPPLCMGLVFNSSDARSVTSTGDWAPGFVKAECPLNQGGQGISIDTYTTNSPTHALYCGRELNSKFSPHSGCRTINFQSMTVGSSWDGSNIAGECNAGEYVAGVAHANGAPTHLLCCPGTGLGKTSCSATVLSATSNVPASGFDYVGQNWDGVVPFLRTTGMATCVGGKYLAGVSRGATGATTNAIYCCSP